MGYRVTNPAEQHNQAAVINTLQRLANGRGLRNTLPGQIVHGSDSNVPVVNSRQTHRNPDAYCWCQLVIVRSTFDRVARGLTESCGAPYCKEPE